MAGRVNGSRPFRTPLSMFTPQASSLGPYSFRPYSGLKGFKGFKGGRLQGNKGNQFQGGIGSSYQSSCRGRDFKGKGAKGRGKNTFSKPGWLSSPLSQAKIPTAWPWWEKWASKEVLHLLSYGVEPDFACPTLPIIPQVRSFKDQESAMQIIPE
jgi:hypothetical protein